MVPMTYKKSAPQITIRVLLNTKKLLNMTKLYKSSHPVMTLLSEVIHSFIHVYVICINIYFLF